MARTRHDPYPIVTFIGFPLRPQAESFYRMVTKGDDYQIVEFVPFETFGSPGTSKTVFCYAVMAKEATNDVIGENRKLKEKLEQAKKELKHAVQQIEALSAELGKAKALLIEATKLRFD